MHEVLKNLFITKIPYLMATEYNENMPINFPVI